MLIRKDTISFEPKLFFCQCEPAHVYLKLLGSVLVNRFTFAGQYSMAPHLHTARKLFWILMNSLLRFTFMFVNNCVAIPSYCLYLLVLQPLRVVDAPTFWYIEGVMFRWLLAMVASWGWCAGYTVTEWGDDVRPMSEDEAMVIVNHQSTGDVCTLMMCLQDKGTVVRKMMWLMDHVFKYTNFGVVSLIHGDFFIRQGKAHREKQLVYLKDHLDKYYYSRDRKWIVLFPEGGFLRKRRETSQSFAKKKDLPYLTHVTLPRLGATEIILKTLGPQQENGILGTEGNPPGQSIKAKGLQWVIDMTIAYPNARPMDIQTWIFGYRDPTVTHVHYRTYPIKDVPVESEALTDWLYQRFVEKEKLLAHFYKTGAFPPPDGQKELASRNMTLDNVWLLIVQTFAFASGYMWYSVLTHIYCWFF
ncbi:acyl-CoA:lysophosphatidylglycerol acyltransferase 1-like isoform X1 [Cyprinus carpio]|uniref:Acyl-CoA:lysophosphatidylglycerol acyltransferase 1-like n=3 Tax=Cyprinus carpio TaxID=7962 RepID=A0A9Q9Z7E8_CYPCA|nr:acyl-CoA:lysophosphatidylglycerol acyltransferase 1-like isoform X1 [Cyprinus carpio]